jgi:hypothetical protein
MARRRNAIFHRLSRMRGLPPDEKMLMQRIGNLMDAALNNRQASNPFEPSRNKLDRVLYPPTGLLAHTGFRTLKLTWNAANSDQHLRYEVEIRNVATGETVTKSTYTNELKFKGDNGTYEAKVKSVGRDSASSPVETIEFTMGGSVMQIEGSKNGPTALGTLVQDHITLYDGYSIYAWASVVLDKYAAGSANSDVVFRLWSMEGENQTFDADVATLHETIVLYAATESFSDLDETARGHLILRPIAARPGSFETSQSVMFSPIRVDSDDDEVVFTFFLQAINRETEEDEVNLSLVLWGGFDGLGDNVPGDPWDGGKADYVFPHLNSLKIWREEMDSDTPPNVTKGRWFMASQPKELNVIDNAWTLAFWVRLPDEHISVMTSKQDEEFKFISEHNHIFGRWSHNTEAPFETHDNHISVDLHAMYDPNAEAGLGPGHGYQPNVTVRVQDKSKGNEYEIVSSFWTYCFGDTGGDPGGPDDMTDQSYMWSHGGTIFSHSNFGWQFYVICFEGGAAGTEEQGNDYPTGTPKIRVYYNGRSPTGCSSPEDRFIAADQMCYLAQRAVDGALLTQHRNPFQLTNKECNQDNSDDFLYSMGMTTTSPLFTSGVYDGQAVEINNHTFQIHQMGMWNVAIDNWDGMGFNPGAGEQRDSAPWYNVPYDEFFPPLTNQLTVDVGRENCVVGSSLCAIHYLFNQGYGTDVDWKKNSAMRPDGAREYIFAENLIHLWQFGAIPDGFELGDESMRDTGNFLYGGDINWLGTIEPTEPGKSSNSWNPNANLTDIWTPVRYFYPDPSANSSNVALKARFQPGPWGDGEGIRDWRQQHGTVVPAGEPNAGTTSSRYAYPGQGLRRTEAQIGGDAWQAIGWRRPNTTNGVLNEPKTWGPVYQSTTGQGTGKGLAQSEVDNGADEWPEDCGG